MLPLCNWPYFTWLQTQPRILGLNVAVAGWGIVCDLITRVAKMHGESVGDHPAAWYEKRYGHEPDYSELLAAVARLTTLVGFVLV